MMRDEIAGFQWSPVSRRVGYYRIANSELEIPIIVICGKEEGPVVLITGGIHNAEYVGIQAATELAHELNPEEIKGTVILLPLVNRTGFEHRTMSLVYEDEKNLNREFPGNREGTLGERICWSITEDLFKKIDYYIDLHCGDGYEELIPYIYCVGEASKETAQTAREMALVADVKYYTVSSAVTGAYNHAGILGVPAVLLERGCMGCWSTEEVEADKKDVRNILRHLNVLSGEKETTGLQPNQVENVIYENAQATGYWYPSKKAGDFVEKEEVLGVIKGYLGETLQVCRARQQGLILYQVRSLSIIEGGPMITYGMVKESDMTRMQAKV